MDQAPRTIFVFGSNLLGIHRRGAAKDALDHWGAIMNDGVGLQGQSYALPTKRTPSESLTLPEVRIQVDNFVKFATDNPHLQFIVTRVGCGLAGFTDDQIAPLFAGAPTNCAFDPAWSGYGLKAWVTAP